MRRYLILIEPTATGFSAYSPDLPAARRPAKHATTSSGTCETPSSFTSRGSVSWVSQFLHRAYPRRM